MFQGKPTMLVVDADASHRQSLRRQLRAEGYRVLEAVDYRDAENVQQQHRGQIDLLLTSVSLPGGNGYELAKSLLGLEPELGVLFVTGETGAKVGQYYDSQWPELHKLTRPFRAADLSQRVHAILRSRATPRLERTACGSSNSAF
jgi:two-component system cell cycle sensor histidine kinase/response regulator CckA